jgi:hypothetical protein
MNVSGKYPDHGYSRQGRDNFRDFTNGPQGIARVSTDLSETIHGKKRRHKDR